MPRRQRRLHSPIGSRRWVTTLAALTGTTALSIDMSLPAQPTLAREFAVAPETAQLSLGLYLAGFALGRRRVLIAGLAVFTGAGVACAAAPSTSRSVDARATSAAFA